MIIGDCLPGDVFNIAVYDHEKGEFFDRMAHTVVDTAVVKTQKMVFGEWSNFVHVHTEIYIGNGKVFSIEPPKPLIKPFILDGHFRADVLRWKHFDLRMVPDMLAVIDKIISYDKPYDVGQLMDSLINSIMGYPYRNEVKIFDFGKHNLVCSSGTAVVFNCLRKIWNKPRPFSMLNEQEWSKRFVSDFKKYGSNWLLERTFPANFSNTYKFNNEFSNMGWMI